MSRREHYDFVIVGGGSAGSALANRLSADPANSVLVLEAGRPDFIWDPFIHMPAALPFPIGNRLYDWRYETEPEPYMNNRRIAHARGKVLGGSSSINGMIFQRGNPLDYERWGADPGMRNWDFAHCLPYFNRMENCLASDPDDPYRGHDGPLALERGPATNPLFEAFFTAGVGENSAEIRARVCRTARWLGVELDDAANAAGGPRISTAASRVAAWTIPTNEELMIARHTEKLLAR